MCGRYYYVKEELTQEGKWLSKLLKKHPIDTYEQGEIFPSQRILALIYGDNGALPKVLTWGIIMYEKRLINARSETIHVKKTFRRMLDKRCAVVCNGFYEWQKQTGNAQKIYIAKENEKTCYLAGLYEQDCLVILTGEAQNEMRKIHHRTPLLMNHEQMMAYLSHQYDPVVDNDRLLFTKTN